MTQTKEQKKKVIDELKDKIGRQKAMVFVDFTGLKVKDLSALRKKLAAAAGEFKVAKKTLIGIALRENNIDIDAKKFNGELAVVFGGTDEIRTIKEIYKFTESSQKLKILGGYFENRFLDADSMIELAKLPSRDELLARLIGGIASPISGFANVLQGNIKGLLYVLIKAKA